jgi:hypothetical protein
VSFTLIVPYYDNPAMLRRQAEEWARYPESVRVIVVDDGSPGHPAVDVVPADSRAAIYRVGVDIPWNRNGARNLGAAVAKTNWILHTDVDHVLPTSSAEKLVMRELDPDRWYRFERWRVGRADETRKKDPIPADKELGQVKPHNDSFICTLGLYWRAGGYDEDFSGSLGGSAPFLGWMKKLAGDAAVLPIPLFVHTRNAVADASESVLSRDRSRFERLRREKRKAGDPRPTDHVRFPWRRVR